VGHPGFIKICLSKYKSVRISLNYYERLGVQTLATSTTY
jgi:hypothetical protein